MHRNHNNKLAFVFSEESDERVTLKSLYEMAVSLSAEMLRNGETKSNVAIIGRMASKSFAGTLSQMLIGNSALCIDWLVLL